MRDTKCLKPVQKLLDDFKDEHPYFFYLWLDWSDRLKQAEAPDCKNPTRLLPHKELAHVPSNLATMQQQILRLFQTVLDASITDVDFSIRVQAYEQAPSLQKFDFQPMKISFEFVGEKQLRSRKDHDAHLQKLRQIFCPHRSRQHGVLQPGLRQPRPHLQGSRRDAAVCAKSRAGRASENLSPRVQAPQGRFRRKHSPLGVRKHRRKRRSARQGKSQKTSLRNGYIGNTQYVENNWFSFNSVLICLYGSLRASFIMVSSKIEDALTLTGGKL